MSNNARILALDTIKKQLTALIQKYETAKSLVKDENEKKFYQDLFVKLTQLKDFFIEQEKSYIPLSYVFPEMLDKLDSIYRFMGYKYSFTLAKKELKPLKMLLKAQQEHYNNVLFGRNERPELSILRDRVLVQLRSFDNTKYKEYPTLYENVEFQNLVELINEYVKTANKADQADNGLETLYQSLREKVAVLEWQKLELFLIGTSKEEWAHSCVQMVTVLRKIVGEQQQERLAAVFQLLKQVNDQKQLGIGERLTDLTQKTNAFFEFRRSTQKETKEQSNSTNSLAKELIDDYKDCLNIIKNKYCEQQGWLGWASDQLDSIFKILTRQQVGFKKLNSSGFFNSTATTLQEVEPIIKHIERSSSALQK